MTTLALVRRCVFLALCAALPGVAMAQPALSRSDPGPTALLSRAPQDVSLFFGAPVELNFSRITLTNSKGTNVPLGEVGRAQFDQSTLHAQIMTELPQGNYFVTWSTSDQDGKALKGTYGFHVMGPNETVDPAFSAAVKAAQDSFALSLIKHSSIVVESDEAQTLRTIEPLRIVARTFAYVGLICIMGAVLLRVAVLTRVESLDPSALSRMASAMSWIAAGGALLHALVALLRLWIQPVLVAGLPTNDIAHRMAMVSTTEWGSRWMTQFASAAVACVAFLLARGKGILMWVIAAAAAIALAFGTALQAHAGGEGFGHALSIGADTIHIVAAAGWVGGVLLLALVCAPISKEQGRDVDRRWHSLMTTSTKMFVACAGLAIVAGGIDTTLRLRSPHDLIGTSYGNAMIAKVVIALALLALSAVDWRRAPAAGLYDENADALRSGWVREIAVGMAILIATAIVVGVPSPHL